MMNGSLDQENHMSDDQYGMSETQGPSGGHDGYSWLSSA